MYSTAREEEYGNKLHRVICQAEELKRALEEFTFYPAKEKEIDESLEKILSHLNNLHAHVLDNLSGRGRR